MRSGWKGVVLGTTCLGALALAALVVRGRAPSAEAATGADSLVADWPAESQIAAKALIERYGEPLESTRDYLTWYGPGPWKRTVLRRSDPGGNIVEQTAVFIVPARKIAALKRFDPRVHADSSIDEMVVRSESPTTNFLLANLAYEIVRDVKTVPEAREFYRRQSKLSRSGKTSGYLSRLLFASRS